MGYFPVPTLRFSYNIYTQNRQITDGKVKCLFTECFYVNRIAPTKRTPPLSPKGKKEILIYLVTILEEDGSCAYLLLQIHTTWGGRGGIPEPCLTNIALKK
jgi:hypothetical protein